MFTDRLIRLVARSPYLSAIVLWLLMKSGRVSELRVILWCYILDDDEDAVGADDVPSQ